jgi:regulator of RNase E activity RraB
VLLSPPVTIALEWLRQQCLVITFDEMKASTTSVIRRILNHCGIDDVTDEEIEHHAAAHSFERMTGRQMAKRAMRFEPVISGAKVSLVTGGITLTHD